MSGGFVYRAEVKGIQSWILASDRLKELKGGSAIVDDLARDGRAWPAEPRSGAEKLLGRTGGTLRSAAAGAVEIWFDDSASLGRFARAWPLLVAQRAPGLQVIQAWASVPGTGEAAAWASVFKNLGKERNLLPVELPEAGPLIARAGRTGLPAAGRSSDGLYDRSIVAKLARANEGDRLDGLAHGHKFETDADAIGDGYLALIHADGNGLGQIFMDMDAEKRQPFSVALSRACWAAASDAVGLLVRDTEDGSTIRARPIVVGGDDFTFLVRANVALPFTIAYLKQFETLTSAFYQGSLTAAAGVAIVKTGFPFHAAHALAENLCKATKSRLRGANESGLLFHRVTTASTSLDWSDIERAEFGVRRPGGEGRLSGGPYTLDEATLLSKLAFTMRDLPRGAMREWLTRSRQDGSRADALWDRTEEVAGKRWLPFAEALTDLSEQRFHSAPKRGWSLEGAVARTPIGDALMWRQLQPADANRAVVPS